ncbi:NUDIX domain-containing protein [Roseovarius spongiae]|uniref:Putative gamma-glutamylcyclotransferase n=1 Tax=Roseovarius spongiae TaxID=2320272 RepID=A0A3A8BCC2_9RHOB|nr:NUDIX domain-containing protein [Roseovarius spongiae]RKF17262.1 NUDIX domain-containing protein [Roseovarius spongiae]
MTTLFFYGTLRDPELLRIVIGTDPDDMRITPAVLPDHAVDWARGQSFPTLTPQAGAQAEGLLATDLSEAEVARFDFYEGSFGYRLRAVEVRAGGEARTALVYFPDPGLWERGARFDLGDWQARFGPLARLSAVEEMSYFGRISGEELSRRVPMIRARAAARLAAATGVPADIRSDCSANEVEQVGFERAHAGFFVTDIHELRYPTFAGGMGPVLRREVFVATDAAIVLPYDPARDRVLLVEQFRMGPYRRGDPRPWMLEPVAGRVDANETPEDCARRECKEEARLELRALEHVASFYATPGTSTEYFHAYVGLCDLPDAERGTGGLDSEDEDIRTHVLSFNAAQNLLSTGEADNGPLVVALLWLAQARERLRR